MKNILLIVCLASFVLISCKHEDPFEREQKEMDEALASSQLEVYKSFKVALRGTAATGKDSAFDQARRELLSGMAYSFTLAADSSKKVDLFSAVNSSTKLVSAVALLSKSNEDSLPTVLENISFMANAGKPLPGDPLLEYLNESEEHAVLGALWMGTPSAPAGLSLYEILRVKEEELRSIDVRIISMMGKCMMYLQHKWPYHSEKISTELIALLEKEKVYLVKNPWPMVDANGKVVSAEQSWHQLHGMGLLMRALSRMQMEEKDQEYTEDLSGFVADAEAGGFDNEAVWSIGALVAIKKDEKDNAVKYLGKLEASKNISEDEREAITETKKYLEEKKNDEALAEMKDKIKFGNIGLHYFSGMLMHSKPVAQLGNSQGGKQFLAITDIGFGNVVSETKEKVDSALEESKNVIKDLFK